MSIRQRSAPFGRDAFSRGLIAAGIFIIAMLPAARASAELAISQLIVELKPQASRSADIEIYNDSDERSFVSVEPREIIDAGLGSERPLLSPNPEILGLLVSPTRLVIEPHQRKRLRISAIGPVPAKERVYRVTVKPVAGEVTGSESGLKMLIGYDLLILVRAPAREADLAISREGSALTIVNIGSGSVELAEGKQCEIAGSSCRQLPSKRLYPGVSWRQSLPLATAGEYRVRSGTGWSKLKF